MKPIDEKNGVPSFDEIVFEKRNKEYGAYLIRKKYNLTLIWAILVSIFCVSATVITSFVIKPSPPIVKEIPIDSVDVSFDSTIINMKFTNPDPPKPEPTVKPPAYLPPTVVDTIPIGSTNQFGAIGDYEKNAEYDSLEIGIAENPKIDIVPPDENDRIVDIGLVAEKPLFGTEGDNEFRRWIAKNIVYPEGPRDNGIQGRVYVQFIVEKDGSITNVEAIKFIDPDLAKEAVRVVSLSPSWTPGKQQGYPVRVRFIFPITFVLDTQ